MVYSGFPNNGVPMHAPSLAETTAFVAVGELKNFTKAAKQLALSPPRVNEMVRNLTRTDIHDGPEQRPLKERTDTLMQDRSPPDWRNLLRRPPNRFEGQLRRPLNLPRSWVRPSCILANKGRQAPCASRR
jgi:hypothetical protein